MKQTNNNNYYYCTGTSSKMKDQHKLLLPITVPTESAVTKYNVPHAAVVKYMLCLLTLIIHVSKKE